MSLGTPRQLNYLTIKPQQLGDCNKRLQIPGKAVQTVMRKGLPHTKGSAVSKVIAVNRKLQMCCINTAFSPCSGCSELERVRNNLTSLALLFLQGK